MERQCYRRKRGERRAAQRTEGTPKLPDTVGWVGVSRGEAGETGMTDLVLSGHLIAFHLPRSVNGTGSSWI